MRWLGYYFTNIHREMWLEEQGAAVKGLERTDCKLVSQMGMRVNHYLCTLSSRGRRNFQEESIHYTP